MAGLLEIISFVAFILSYLIGIFSENKYNFVNKVKRLWAKIWNKSAQVNLVLEYESKADFETIKEKFKDNFRIHNNFKVIKEGKMRMDFSFDIFLVTIIHNQINNVHVEVERMESGINDLYKKLNQFLSDISNLSKPDVKILEGFISSEIVLRLPYNWNYVNINKPDQFQLKDYKITIEEEEDFKCQVEIHMDKIVATVDTKEALVPLLQKLL